MQFNYKVVVVLWLVVVVLTIIVCRDDGPPIQGQSDWVLQNLKVTPTPKLIKLTVINLESED
jgi:hypothetical protein